MKGFDAMGRRRAPVKVSGVAGRWRYSMFALSKKQWIGGYENATNFMLSRSVPAGRHQDRRTSFGC